MWCLGLEEEKSTASWEKERRWRSFVADVVVNRKPGKKKSKQTCGRKRVCSRCLNDWSWLSGEKRQAKKNRRWGIENSKLQKIEGLKKGRMLCVWSFLRNPFVGKEASGVGFKVYDLILRKWKWENSQKIKGAM